MRVCNPPPPPPSIQKLATLEKALVDEYQYRTGKATLESELKTMLDKHQKSLDPNDKVCTMNTVGWYVLPWYYINIVGRYSINSIV